jgi:NAD(P)-dependent dehydrogenase (short-subunit alcohol dehydrogenase family)
MKRELTNKVYLVTGGASGLGQATCEHLATLGARTVICDVNVEKGKALEASLKGSGLFVKVDVTQPSDIQTAIDAAFAKWSRLDGAVNCAGIGPAERLVNKEGEPHSIELFTKVLQINLFGTFHVNRLVASALCKKTKPSDDGERGVLIQTASVAAFDGQIGQTAYAASKAALAGMTLPQARDLSKAGIRVMTIAPGIFETPLLMGMPEAVRASLGAQVPFPSRLGRPLEYAYLVESILTNPMLNGETIRLDGAIRMTPK